MRRFSARVGWGIVLPLAAVGAALNCVDLSSRRAQATPPPPHVSEPPFSTSSATGATAAVAGAQARRAKHVLIISEDGLRGDAIEKLNLHWHEQLKKRGAWSIKAKTIRQASTLPAHASMLSGVHPNVHGLTWNNWRPSKGYIKSPTIFSRASEAGLTTAFFTGKSKLRHIVPPGVVDVYDRPGYYCKKVAEEAAEYLLTQKPALAFVHFSDPDEVGHAKGWMSPQQLKAILDSDRCLGILIDALERGGLLDDTLIIVSADHGGHNKTHSGASLIDREIPWIACGPGVREGFRIKDEISTVDTAATALYALGLPIPPELAGKPRTEIFVNQ
jgi:predicted AlkP superfamily pyrophosphatase or phosphodiesterase